MEYQTGLEIVCKANRQQNHTASGIVRNKKVLNESRKRLAVRFLYFILVMKAIIYIQFSLMLLWLYTVNLQLQPIAHERDEKGASNDFISLTSQFLFID